MALPKIDLPISEMELPSSGKKIKRVVIFSLPGAFTPTFSTYQVPGFEENYDLIRDLDIDEVYCASVNDSFVMNKWAKDQGVEKIKMIPDGTGTFTRQMGMLVDKSNLGFGMRSWRYAMVVKDGVIERLFVEPGMRDNATDDPYGETSPQVIIDYLKKTV
jgi:peroxiredoxin